jgi:hypothetical protein
MIHRIRIGSEQTGSSSHYDIPSYSTYLICDCGWRQIFLSDGKFEQRKEYWILRHKLDLVLEVLDIKVRKT